MELYNSGVKRIAIENPVGIMSTRFRKADQIIEPWMFGDEASKKTCLWLKNLPKEERQKIRSKTFPGIAEAIAEQWGSLK